ncbi:MAG: hypothetical protein GY786_05145 [Proteobacteria bacterium]|nr:hypothetical protein [Pseudomonadota bacterium]
MVEGIISKLDLSNRTAIILDDKGVELPVRFSERTNIEVIEQETVGLVGGELEDLDVGFHIEMDLISKKEDGTYLCDSLVCLS